MNPSQCRVLVVDDHALQRLLLVRMLSALPVSSIVEADGGGDALRRIDEAGMARQPFDLVITDLDMPAMDGMELTRRIAARPDAPPVALVSALEPDILASVGTLSRAAGGALLSILPKPVSIDGLRAAIERIGLPASSPADREAGPRYPLAEIATGLHAGQFRPWFEPQVDLCTGEVTGFEALARWHHPRDGVVAPQHFIDSIEANPALIDRLTMTMLEQGLVALRGWPAGRPAGRPALTLSVNLSPRVLADVGFAARLVASVAVAGIDPARITFELTESTAATGAAALENITRLRMRGFRLAIDDFGTGYATLAQLSELPLAELKIDRQFTARMLDDRVARAAVESSLQLAQRLNLRSCGEGIESAAILRELRWMGGTVGQGYLFTRPLPADAVAGWLAGWPVLRGELVEEWRAD